MGSINGQAEEYDIIIVGAGTAGCVLANRLSEDPSVSVLVLEAGEDRSSDERVCIPGLGPQLLANDDFDWQYESVPQPGINGRTIKHPRGKVVGGSSAINSFALVYPNRAGMDAWEELGNQGWGWKAMEPYFRKFQTVEAPSARVREEMGLRYWDAETGSTKGPIRACFPITAAPLQMAWVDSFRELNMEIDSSPLDGEAIGGGITTCHVSAGKRERSHAGVAYLDPVKGRINLNLMTRALVRKIVFDRAEDGNVVARGIEYVRDGVERFASAKKEVLLAAGCFGTPQLLELSGIGDSSILKEHGIATVYHSPNVGENLHDHMRPGLGFEAAEGVEVRGSVSDSEARKLYEANRTGRWADGTCFTFAYMPLVRFLSDPEKHDLTALLDKHLSDPELPEFQQKRNSFIRNMLLSPIEGTATAFLSRKPAVSDPQDRNWIWLYAMLSHPFSRGHTHIRSSNPLEKPDIDFKYYTHPLDVEVHAHHARALQKLAATESLSKYFKPNGDRMPAKSGTLGMESAKAYVREVSATNYHPCGTCSMIPESIGGVVDERLRVYGTRNVRVVDASIMPIIPRGNIITTVYAVAEKAADLVSEDLKIPRTT